MGRGRGAAEGMSRPSELPMPYHDERLALFKEALARGSVDALEITKRMPKISREHLHLLITSLRLARVQINNVDKL